MSSLLKRLALAVMVIVNFTMVFATPAAAANTATLAITPSTQNVQPGAAFTFDVNVTASTAVGSFQTALSWDPNSVTVNTITDGSFFVNYGNQQGVAPSIVAPFTINNTTGQSAVGSVAFLGLPSGQFGPSGSGQLLHVTATAKNVNAVASLGIAPAGNSGTLLVVGGTSSGFDSYTITGGSVTVGTPPQPDLTVINPATVAVNGTPTSFNVTFVVKNVGNASDGVATVASVAVTNASPASGTVNIPILAAGADSGTQTVGPFALAPGQTLSNVTITADSTHLVQNSQNNQVNTTAYSYAAISSTGNTTITSNLAATLTLTPPPAISNWVLVPGTTNNQPDGYLGVKGNVNFTVNVNDANPANNGHQTEFDPGTGTFVAGGAQLIQPVVLQQDSGPNSVTISGVPQLFFTGTRSGGDPNNGYQIPTTFHQFVGFNDAPVNAPHYYEEVVQFTANGSF